MKWWRGNCRRPSRRFRLAGQPACADYKRLSDTRRFPSSRLSRLTSCSGGWQSAAGCRPAPQSGKPQTTLAFLRHCRRCRQADCQSAGPRGRPCQPAPHRFSDLLEVAQNLRGTRIARGGIESSRRAKKDIDSSTPLRGSRILETSTNLCRYGHSSCTLKG